MIPATHVRLGIQITNQWDEEQRSMASVEAFLDGSTLPDRYLPLRLMTHGFPQSGPYIFGLLASLIHKRLSPKTFGRRLGIVAHFLADYACAYHSKPSLKNRIFGHRAYERNLDSFPLHLTEESPVTIRSLASLWNDLETYVARRHNDKVENNPQQDVNDAAGMIQRVSNLVFAAALANQRVQSPLRVAFFSDTYFPHVNGVSNTPSTRFVVSFKNQHRPSVDRSFVCETRARTRTRRHAVSNQKRRFPLLQRRDDGFSKPPSNRCRDELVTTKRHPRDDRVQSRIVRRSLCEKTSDSAHYQLQHPLPYGRRPLRHRHDRRAAQTLLGLVPPSSRLDFVSLPRYQTLSALARHRSGVRVRARRRYDAVRPEHRSLALRKEWAAETKTVFLYVGRVSGEKDLPVLIEAYERFSKEDQNETKLVIVGDGPERMTLESAHPEILYAGTLSGTALSAAYASADIFVFPSPSETLGNVVLEAMASALPVVCVGSGGVLDVVKDHANGFLVPPQDVAAFHDAMHLLFRNNLLRSRLGQAGRKDALRKSWDDVFDRLIDRYLTLQYEKDVSAEPLEQSCPLVPDRIGSFKSV
ncbi:MAG: glycosyltransferase [Bacillus subtilis]|nr:glycosyltransferase [Bacillus subtilis]